MINAKTAVSLCHFHTLHFTVQSAGDNTGFTQAFEMSSTIESIQTQQTGSTVFQWERNLAHLA